MKGARREGQIICHFYKKRVSNLDTLSTKKNLEIACFFLKVLKVVLNWRIKDINRCNNAPFIPVLFMYTGLVKSFRV